MFTAYLTPRDGTPRRIALLSFDRSDAMQEARLLGLAMFGRFTFSIRSAT